MPKPAGKRNWKSNQYFEHDFRSDNAHSVQFKKKHVRTDRYQKDWTDAVRSHFAEEDIDMSNVNIKNISTKKYLKKHRSASPMPHTKVGSKRKLLEGPTGWYRVILPFGNKYDKPYILKTLLDKLSPEPFQPITWQVNGNSCTFFVDNFKVAEKLHNMDKEIQLPDGFKLLIRVSIGCPNIDVNSAMKEKMKLAMVKRYNPATRALDLAKFHADPDLSLLFCALFKPIILLAVIDIIAENIPDIEAINLSDNKIQILNHLRRLSHKLPNLKILHLGNNKIKDIIQLDSLMGLNIIELVLDGNPLCDKFKDQSTYISEVRKRFPKVMKLDGTDLPPPISFDISEEVHMPQSQQTFLCSADGQGIVRQFLEQYFQIMDSDNRQPLASAYHENALLSMTMCYPYGQHQKNSSWLNWYGTDNRNILRVTDSDRRLRLLKQGQLAIISFLQEMPSSKHDIHSFTVDLNLFTSQMLLLSVSGMFRELNSGHKSPPLRYFFRTLVIVPAGSGFCIVNEELHMSNATEEQSKRAFKTPIAATSAPSSVPDVVVPATSAPNDEVKAQMVLAMEQQSGMNSIWSEKCLAESDWDFQRAIFVFTQLQGKGVIPPDAFVKS
ncbi:hypothetical protein AMK59_7798 [Oryctes borbonicus]|uniref:TAP-C domain-containing protein n=1 Tax=Oryctes borbonicus TaxID=1629725 RepID=A0A0T6AVG7_9SCAR|nr:hypothetical protein AMK59_7798 [Oryctes borbonicus]